MSRSELWTRSFTFVATGVLSTLGYQWLYYQGAGGGGMAMTSSLPNYIGMLLALGSPKVRRNFLNSDYPDRGIKQIMITSLIDVIGSALTGFGLFYTGSGVYQIIYSSVVIFTALLSKFIIKKPLNTVQWACVILVNVGLALSASSLDTTETSSRK
jgi:drug/metabolite transporter (DMT)-like permease